MILAIIAITRNGARLGARLHAALPGAELYVAERFAAEAGTAAIPFNSGCRELLASLWSRYRGFACIMASGIVVRAVAPLLVGKDRDPAVVVLDEAGRFAVSLLSGHLGGANQLTHELAAACGATPVITTATDVHGLTAWDEAARRAGLRVEPLAQIKHLNRLLVDGERIALVDGRGRIAPLFAGTPGVERYADCASALRSGAAGLILVSHDRLPAGAGPEHRLALRPRDLVVGIGCNRGTGADEIAAAVTGVFERAGLALASVARLASVRAKADEAGLLAFAGRQALPLDFFPAEQLNTVIVPSPGSAHALAAVGAHGVCEPAAILAACGGPLLVGKQKCGNVTVAVAGQAE